MIGVIPKPPEVPLSQRGSGRVALRYEDVSQRGQLLPGAMPAALGEIFWRGTAREGGLRSQLDGSGIVPILTRLCCASLEGPISVANPLTVHSRYQLAHARDERGDVARVLLNVWLDVRAPRAVTNGPAPADAGEVVAAGAMFAEHVFTRPFAATSQERRVTELPAGSLPQLPRERAAMSRPEALLLPIAGEVEVLSWRDDAAPVVFGQGDTDGNQHVNSLAYPRAFYAAAMRLLAESDAVADDERAEIELDSLDLRFRKPCFSGDRMRVRLALFQLDGRVGVRAMLLPHDAPEDSQRANVYGRMLFKPR